MYGNGVTKQETAGEQQEILKTAGNLWKTISIKVNNIQKVQVQVVGMIPICLKLEMVYSI
jgi:hypothetical protein